MMQPRNISACTNTARLMVYVGMLVIGMLLKLKDTRMKRCLMIKQEVLKHTAAGELDCNIANNKINILHMNKPADSYQSTNEPMIIAKGHSKASGNYWHNTDKSML